MRALKTLRELGRYPSAVIGVIIIALMVAVSVYTVIAIPYDEAIRLWRAGPGVWEENPRRAAPVWFDWFTEDRVPRTIVVTLEDAGAMTVESAGEVMNSVEVVLPFEYNYDGFPKELSLFTQATFQAGSGSVSIYWRRPDGQIITLQENRLVKQSDSYRISQDESLRAMLRATPEVGLFAEDPAADVKTPLHGSYELVMQGELHGGDEFLEAKLVVYGQVHGLAGTDHLRRDLMVALLWGTPIGLVFGVLAAVGTQVITFVLAGTGAWFGGKLDAIFQRLSELTMILPLLAILIMVGHLYTRSIWVMLGLVILLNIFGASLKIYRSMFLQAKESAYIEAAQAYGAGNFRIIFRYLLPRLLPVLLPEFVIIIPTFVFLEATLAVLGLGDPMLPTWGKVIYDALDEGALYMGDYYWMVLPAALLMLIGLGFALLGYTLDRIFNPRLRTV